MTQTTAKKQHKVRENHYGLKLTYIEYSLVRLPKSLSETNPETYDFIFLLVHGQNTLDLAGMPMRSASSHCIFPMRGRAVTTTRGMQSVTVRITSRTKPLPILTWQSLRGKLHAANDLTLNPSVDLARDPGYFSA